MDVVEMVLGGLVNKEIVSLITRHGGRAIGLTGKDGDLIRARKMRVVVDDGAGRKSRVDIGLVGEVVEVNPEVIRTLEQAGFIPVVAPTGCGRDGQTYNINADVAAGKIAAALGAEKLILLSDVEGVKDRDGRLIPTLSAAEARRLVARGVIQQGMIPKVILDGRVRHAVLLEIFTRSGVGTEVIHSRGKLAELNGGARGART
jgi:acetylglutamate kinase